MGNAFAPSEVNLFMAYLKEQFIKSNQKKPFFANLMVYFWHINDIFLCLCSNLNSEMSYLDWMNGMHPTIKLIVSGRQEGVNYLDTTVFTIPKRTVAVRLYHKENKTI